MKKTLLFAVLLLSPAITSLAQDARNILMSSYAKCQSIQNGYYEMDRYRKFTDEKDTLKGSVACYFKKLKDDSLYAAAFHYRLFDQGSIYKGDVLYTGNDFVLANAYDSIATVMSKTL